MIFRMYGFIEETERAVPELIILFIAYLAIYNVISAIQFHFVIYILSTKYFVLEFPLTGIK